MSVPSHSALVTGATERGPRRAGKTIAPVQTSKSLRSHDDLLHAVGQLDRLLDELEQDGVDEAGRSSARALVARLDELLDTRFGDRERRLLAQLHRDADAGMRQATDTLRVDQEWITGNWRELRPMLDSIARSYCWADIDALRSAAELFTALVRDHVDQQAALLASASPMRS
jgi:Hemerythrin HHE cation binding domain